MANAISNALGTQRQFTPLPDAVYQGRYIDTIAAPRQANQSNGWMTLGANLDKLGQALQGYAVSHEKYLEAVGTARSEAMVKGATPADVEKLNTIDMAQQYGFADSTDNPYFVAHAEKLRGNYVSALMKQAYDAQYANDPAKTADEEAKRYSDFALDYKKRYLNDSYKPSNSYAFDLGWNESGLVNAGQLVATWTKKKNENDVINTVADIQSRLGAIRENAPELLKTNGAMTQAVQEVFNDGRLAGLPQQYRQKLLEDWSTEMVSTGFISADRFEQMMDNIDVQTNIDGTAVKASELIDMSKYKDYASKWHSQFHTKQKYDWRKKYVKQGKNGIANAMLDVERMMETNPREAAEYNVEIPRIISEVTQNENAKKAALSAAMRSKGGGNGGSTITDPKIISGLLDGWRNNMTYDRNGRVITGAKVDKDTAMAVMSQALQEAVANDDINDYIRIMDFPPCKEWRETFTRDLKSQMARVAIMEDGSISSIGNPAIQKTLDMLTKNRKAVGYLYGAEVEKDLTLLYNLQTMQGYDAGWHTWATYTSATDDARNEAKNSIESAYTYTDLKTRRIADYSDDTVEFQGGNIGSNLTAYIKELATSYKLCGYSAGEAVEQAREDISHNFVSFHNAMLPESWCMSLTRPNGEFVNQPQKAMKRALSNFAYTVTGMNNGKYSGVDDNAESVRYEVDYNTRMIYGVNIVSGDHAEISLDTLRANAVTCNEDMLLKGETE